MIFPASIWNNLPVVSIDGKEYPKAGYVQTSREVEIAPDPPEAKKAAARDAGSSAKDDESVTTEAAIRAGEKVTKAKMVQFVTDRKLDIESPSALPGPSCWRRSNKNLDNGCGDPAHTQSEQ